MLQLSTGGGAIRRRHPSLTDLRHGHALGAGLGTLLLAVAPGVGNVPLDIQIVVLVAAVGLLGIPHGALDHLAGRELLRPRFGWSWVPLFFGAYGLFCALVVALWLRAPAPSLVAFLLVAAVHFGAEDREAWSAASRRPQRSKESHLTSGIELFTRGSLPIVLPSVAFQPEMGALFDLLGLAGETPNGPGVARGIAALLPLVAVSLVAWSVLRLREAWKGGTLLPLAPVVEVAVLMLLFLRIPPLLSFVVYFTGWHAARHTLAWAGRLDPLQPARGLRTFARLAIPLTLATLALGVAGWWLLPETPEGRSLTLVFVGLAALTYPHVVLEEAVRRGKPNGLRGAGRQASSEL